MRKIKMDDLSIYLVSIIIVIINIPLLSITIKGVGIVILMALFIFMHYRDYTHNKKVYIKAVFLSLLYLAMEIIYELIGISNVDYIYYYYTISFFFFAFALPPIVEKTNKYQQKVILVAFFGSLLYAMISNILLSQEYGARYVRLVDYLGTGTNVMSTQYISALVLMCGMIFSLFLYSSKKRLPILIALVFSCWFVIFVGQRTTAMILLFSMMMAQILLIKKRNALFYFVAMIVLILVAFLILNMEAVLIWLTSIINNDRLTVRINQLIVMTRQREIAGAGGSLEVRYNLIGNSINTFFSSLSSFFFGVGDNRNSNLIVGHHSQWIDQGAKYGLLGIVLLALSLKSCFSGLNMSMNLKSNYLKKQVYVFYIYFIIRGAIGAVLYPYFGIILFVIIPIVFKQINEKDISIEEYPNDY